MNKWWKKESYILNIGIVAFVTTSFYLQFIKYKLFLYNGLDLAIFNNVFYNLINFGGFYSSVQGHSYLADHFAPLMFLFLPFYKIYQSPLTLLLLQTVVLGATSWLVYFLSKTFFDLKLSIKNNLTKKLPLIFALTWLINPLLWNVNFYEFHTLTLALPLLLAVLIFYLKNQYALFALTVFLACLVREDVALMIFMLGILAGIDKKKFKFIITPLVLSLVCFIGAMKIINLFTPEGFRFFTYYEWLGQTPLEALTNFLTHPLVWIQHIFTLSNINMLVGLLFPWLFLPLKKPKYLLLSLIPFMQFILSAGGGSNIVVQTHYAVLFLPSLLLTSIEAVSEIIKNPKSKLSRLIKFDLSLSKLIIPAILLLSFLALSPLGLIVLNTNKYKARAENFIKYLEIPDKQKSIAASLDLVPQLSTRSNIYTTYYLFTGWQQYSKLPYKPRKEIEKIFITQDHLLGHWLKIASFESAAKTYHEYFNNWQSVLKNYQPEFYPDGLVVYNLLNSNYEYSIKSAKQTGGCRQESYNKKFDKFTCQFFEPENEIYFIDLNQGQKIIPALWREKQAGGYRNLAVWFLQKNQPAEFNVVKITGQIELGPWSSVTNNIYFKKTITNLKVWSN